MVDFCSLREQSYLVSVKVIGSNVGTLWSMTKEMMQICVCNKEKLVDFVDRKIRSLGLGGNKVDKPDCPIT